MDLPAIRDKLPVKYSNELIMKIDSHVHFWVYDTMINKSWISDSMKVLRNDFLPLHLIEQLREQGMDGCMAVQADQSEVETHYLLALAHKHDFVKGVVGWVDFRAPSIGERLDYFSQFKLLKGFRHIVQAEPNDDFLLSADFCRGISLLEKYNFTYDILIYPRHLTYAKAFIRKFPNQKFVIDHLAKPFIKNREVKEWETQLNEFKAYENVYCKIAGLVTEAGGGNWQLSDFSTYISIALDIFGVDRVMFGSDWPVCLPSASYSFVCDVVDKNTSFLQVDEKAKLWGLNCSACYQL